MISPEKKSYRVKFTYEMDLKSNAPIEYFYRAPQEKTFDDGKKTTNAFYMEILFQHEVWTVLTAYPVPSEHFDKLEQKKLLESAEKTKQYNLQNKQEEEKVDEKEKNQSLHSKNEEEETPGQETIEKMVVEKKRGATES